MGAWAWWPSLLPTVTWVATGGLVLLCAALLIPRLRGVFGLAERVLLYVMAAWALISRAALAATR